MKGAGDTLQEAVIGALRSVPGLGVHTLGPIQSAFPYATVDAGLEADWSHKSGEGREVRLAVTIRDEGERPDRLQRLKREAEATIGAQGAMLEGWRVVSLRFLRSSLVRDGRQSWAALIEYRARMLGAPSG